MVRRRRREEEEENKTKKLVTPAACQGTWGHFAKIPSTVGATAGTGKGKKAVKEPLAGAWGLARTSLALAVGTSSAPSGIHGGTSYLGRAVQGLVGGTGPSGGHSEGSHETLGLAAELGKPDAGVERGTLGRGTVGCGQKLRSRSSRRVRCWSGGGQASVARQDVDGRHVVWGKEESVGRMMWIAEVVQGFPVGRVGVDEIPLG